MTHNELIRIVNTEPRFLTLPKPPTDQKARTLLPGGNNVPRAYFQWLSEEAPEGARKSVNQWFTIGWLKVDHTPGATELPEGPEAPKDLNHLREEAAIIYVENEDSPDVLRQWAKGETRKAVQAALSARVAFLTAAATGGLLGDV